MKVKRLDSGAASTFIVVFENGDEVVSGLSDFVRSIGMGGGRFNAIGAFRDAILGFFEWDKKQYKQIPVLEQVEVLTMVGHVAEDEEGTPKVHAHVVVARSDGSTLGGHLLEAHARPALELILVESPGQLFRKIDPETGLPRIRV